MAAPQVAQGARGAPPAAIAVPAAMVAGQAAPGPLEPLPAPSAQPHVVVVRTGESLRLYERWSGIPRDELVRQNEMGRAVGLRAGREIILEMTPDQAVRFHRLRREHHRRREGEFFQTHRIVRLVPYVMRDGDTVQSVSKRYSDVPRWLMEKVNRGYRLTGLKPGDIINLPVVRAAPHTTSEEEIEARMAGPDLPIVQGRRVGSEDGPISVRAARLDVPTVPLTGITPLPAAEEEEEEEAVVDEEQPASGDEAAPVEDASAPSPTGSAVAPLASSPWSDDEEAGVAPTRAAGAWFGDDEEGAAVGLPATDGVTVRVRKGETLFHYSKWSGLPMDRIVAANTLANPARLALGAVVQVPLPEESVQVFFEKRRAFHGDAPEARPRQRGRASAGASGAAPAAVVAGGRTFGYKVRRGDTGRAIASKHRMSVDELAAHNPGVPLDRLREGQALRIPLAVVDR